MPKTSYRKNSDSLDAINSAFRNTNIQLMVRNSLKCISWKDYKAVTGDLKQIYKATTEEDALLALDSFSER